MFALNFFVADPPFQSCDDQAFMNPDEDSVYLPDPDDKRLPRKPASPKNSPTTPHISLSQNIRSSPTFDHQYLKRSVSLPSLLRTDPPDQMSRSNSLFQNSGSLLESADVNIYFPGSGVQQNLQDPVLPPISMVRSQLTDIFNSQLFSYEHDEGGDGPLSRSRYGSSTSTGTQTDSRMFRWSSKENISVSSKTSFDWNMTSFEMDTSKFKKNRQPSEEIICIRSKTNMVEMYMRGFKDSPWPSEEIIHNSSLSSIKSSSFERNMTSFKIPHTITPNVSVASSSHADDVQYNTHDGKCLERSKCCKCCIIL